MARLQDFVVRHGIGEIERRAVDELRRNRPEFSAGLGGPRRRTIAALALAAALALVVAPVASLIAVQLSLAAVFLAWTGLRLIGLVSTPVLPRRRQSFANDWLPIYSIVVALYREATAVGPLVAALRQLNYPVLGSKLT